MSEIPVEEVPARAASVNPLAAPVDSQWERFTSRLPIVRGRLVGSTAGLLGVLLALPMLFLPTHSISVDAEPGESAVLSFWSWGRIADATPHIQEPLAFNNNMQLVFFIVSLVIGIAACLVYALRTT